MGISTGTPCCPCAAGTMCQPDGEAFWQDDFQSYQENESLVPYGFLQISGAIGDPRWVPIAITDGAGGLCLRSALGFSSAAGRLTPMDFERFTVFEFSCKIISWFGQQSFGIGMAAKAIGIGGNLFSSTAYRFKFEVRNDFGGSIMLEAGLNRTVFPAPPGHPPTSLKMIITITDTYRVPGDTVGIYASGTMRCLDNGGGSFDETISFVGSYYRIQDLCYSTHGIYGSSSFSNINDFLRADDWLYQAT